MDCQALEVSIRLGMLSIVTCVGMICAAYVVGKIFGGKE